MKAILSLFCLVALHAACAEAAQKPSTLFPHGVHLEEGLACEDCHSQARTSRRASDDLLPRGEICLDCHDAGEVPSSWPSPEREYRFSHADHAASLDLACDRCHGKAGAEARAGALLPEMADCMTCHNGEAAPRDCDACHTLSRSELVPASHQPGWKKEHGRQARITDRSCLPCHTVGDCQECHEGTWLAELADLSPSRQTSFAPELEGSRGMVLERVHGLNYRFLHGLEARGKQSECIVCHDLETGFFCAECHNPTLNPDVKPVWHGGADWGSLAPGSGGGRHAELARRDLENCAACHDVQGEDPVCLLCHMDRLPGRGNDPSPHARSFAGDVGEGDFHHDDDAVCFTCHTRGSAAGDGFCGYCHGSK